MERAEKPPIAVVGSGPAGLINAYLLSVEGYPVTVFEAFHDLGGVLRYGIPEFRLPNALIDDVVEKIDALGGKFVKNFVVGKTATLQDLKDAGFYKIFVGTGAGLPRFMNIPGEHLNGVMSANEFLTRVNLMQARLDDYDTPLPIVKDKNVIVIGGGNTAMDAARTSKRLGGNVTIVYRRTRKEMPARVEELAHALEEGIELAVLRAPREFVSGGEHHVCHAVLDVMELGAPDASGRRSPVATGKTETIPVDLAIMALGNDPNPIIKSSEPRLKTSKWGTFLVENGGETTLKDVYSGGDATRGGSTAINAAGDGKAAAEQIAKENPFSAAQIKDMVGRAADYTAKAQTPYTIVKRRDIAQGIVEVTVKAPMVAKSAKAGQFVRVLPDPQGRADPADPGRLGRQSGDHRSGHPGRGRQLHPDQPDAARRIPRRRRRAARPALEAPQIRRQEADRRVLRRRRRPAAGLPDRARAPAPRQSRHADRRLSHRESALFWVGEGERVDKLKAEFGDQLDVIYCTNDGTFGVKGFVTTPLQEMLEAGKKSKGRDVAEVIAIGPPLMMKAVSELTKKYVPMPTVVSLNSIMVDATGMCGACMVPVTIDGKMVRKHACIDGPELDAHIIDWDKYLPRFNQFKEQEQQSRARHGLA